MRLELSCLETSKANCSLQACQADRNQLLTLIGKNLDKIKNISSQQEHNKTPLSSRQEDRKEHWKTTKAIPSSIEPAQEPTRCAPQDENNSLEDEETSNDEDNERTDAAYMEWKNWKIRNKKMQEETERKQLRARMKTDQWALYRECSRLMEMNKKNWKERQEQEKLRRLEEEKAQRLEDGKVKKKRLLEKLSKKKETKSERLKRLEEEKKKAGRQAIRSQLWRQRRDMSSPH